MQIATADSVRWLSELSFTASELTYRHLMVAREWFPHRCIPRGLGRDFDGPLGGEPRWPE
ncbi:hypothetical protein BG452_20795 [Streptomyces sp. CBMA123]|nr:hypothetical protein [Streptomyces sp. CBMA123]